MPLARVIVAVAWFVWLAYWIVAAASAKRTVNRRSNWMVWIMRVIALVVIAWFMRVAGRQVVLVGTNPVWDPLGVVLCVGGLGFAIWARRHLGRNWGMPMSIKADPELVTTDMLWYVIPFMLEP